jgi:predicted P-loop ATPase
MTKDDIKGAIDCGTGATRLVPLIKTANEGVRANLANAITLLSGQPCPEIAELRDANPWNGVLAYDDFAGRPVMRSVPPWPIAEQAEFPRPWEPADDTYAAEWLQHHGVGVSVKVVAQAVDAVARRNRFHPVRDHLEGLQWDGRERADHWLPDFLGARDSDLVRAMGSRWLVAAVARIFKPGCKADCMLILEGPQGSLKSTALRVLADPWFSDDMPEIGTKDASLQASGVWIVELAELDSLARAEETKIKAFMSRRTDRFRPPYGERVIERPRQCLFAGTTNKIGGYLRDETGGRRFWPVRVGEIDVVGLQAARDQLWAEAVARYRNGEPWWLNTPELTGAAASVVAERYNSDAWQDLIADHLVGRSQTSTTEILRDVLKLEVGRWDKSHQTRVGICLSRLGWEKERETTGDRPRFYYPPGRLPA